MEAWICVISKKRVKSILKKMHSTSSLCFGLWDQVYLESQPNQLNNIVLFSTKTFEQEFTQQFFEQAALHWQWNRWFWWSDQWGKKYLNTIRTWGLADPLFWVEEMAECVWGGWIISFVCYWQDMGVAMSEVCKVTVGGTLIIGFDWMHAVHMQWQTR